MRDKDRISVTLEIEGELNEPNSTARVITKTGYLDLSADYKDGAYEWKGNPYAASELPAIALERYRNAGEILTVEAHPDNIYVGVYEMESLRR